MKEPELNLAEIKSKEVELQSLVEVSDKTDLAQCVRLISMYISIYKQQFGELPPESYAEIVTNDEIDQASASIFENGLQEAISILDMVIQSRTDIEHYKSGGMTIN